MRILLVEDDKNVASFLLRGLSEENYAVDVCGNGVEAVECAVETDYDLIILDIMLPRKNGFAVCRELRERSILTPVIMLTAKDAIEDRVSGLDQGADDYLTKPFSFVELLARIRALLRRRNDYRANTLKAADLEFDPLLRSVTRSGKRIDLSGKEYALLEYLIRNRGRILTSTMIIDHVWDRNYDGLSNVVNVTINHLRKKIDAGFHPKLIRTIRGHGFKIDENPED